MNKLENTAIDFLLRNNWETGVTLKWEYFDFNLKSFVYEKTCLPVGNTGEPIPLLQSAKKRKINSFSQWIE
jgi:hypothetical protein